MPITGCDAAVVKFRGQSAPNSHASMNILLGGEPLLLDLSLEGGALVEQMSGVGLVSEAVPPLTIRAKAVVPTTTVGRNVNHGAASGLPAREAFGSVPA